MNNKLYVGNLSYDTSEAKLRELFSPAGTIRSVTIPMDRMTNQPRGFAFVEMESPADALKAIKLCNGQEVDGREIKVNEAKPPENRSSGGGGGDRGPRRNDQNRW
jgi:RNA recognition motif-containing protein